MWSMAFLIQFCVLTLFYNEVRAIIVSPCLVQIVQMPPVFVQNVMIGICENQNQNISTGRVGEFYTCQQRYSVVEVYIAEAPRPSANKDIYAQSQSAQEYPNNLKFTRESVIIESGCDFTFNLLPLIASQTESQPGGHAIPPQQKMLLRSPYHQTIPIRRQQGQYGDSTPGTPANSGSAGYVMAPGYPPNSQGRSGLEDSDISENVDAEEIGSTLIR